MFKTFIVLLFTSTLLFSNIGYIQDIGGEVYLIRDNKILEPSVDMLLNKDDIFSTKKDGRIVIELDDSMIISVGNDSDLKLDTPIRLSRGFFAVRSKKSSFFNTDLISIGVKDTVSYINILPSEIRLALINGDINITKNSDKKEITLPKGILLSFSSDENTIQKSYRCEELEGIDNLDCDQDSIEGIEDKCPNTPAGFLIDKDGCAKSYNLGIYFKENSTEIVFEGDNISKLEKVVAYLKENEDVDIIVENYTSDIKDVELSETRARKVYTAIKVLGIVEDRIKFKGVVDKSKPKGITIIKFIRN